MVASVALMLLMGLGSPYFLRRINASTTAILEDASSREIRVERVVPRAPQELALIDTPAKRRTRPVAETAPLPAER